MEHYPEIPFTIVPGSAGCIALARTGNYLYTAGGDRLSVYDISRPDQPKLCWRRSGFGNGRQLTAAHGRLYGADGRLMAEYDIEEGVTHLSVPPAEGIYVLQICYADGRSESQKITVVRR